MQFVVTVIYVYVCMNVLRFSTDEGQCWKIFNFTDHPIFLAGLASEPGTKTMNISIFGYRPDDDDQPMWVAVTIDFEHLLTRECKKCLKNHGQNSNSNTQISIILYHQSSDTNQ